MATTVEKGRGRVERRTLRVTSALTAGQTWTGLKQGFEVTRVRTVRGQTTTEVSYGITSLSAARADAATLLKYVRDHWRIENQLHYVRDVTLGEDACRVRTGHAPQVLAAVRNTALYLLRTVGARTCAEAIERLQVEPHKARALIGLP